MIMHNIIKKTARFIFLTILGSGITSGGTFLINKLQTEDNKKIQETINQQFVQNDQKMIELLERLDKKIKILENFK
jgi:hypothetical protein